MDNPLITKKAQIIALKDQWIITQGKTNAETKA